MKELTDFELPPLPEERDIPMTMAELEEGFSSQQPDGDMSEVERQQLTDMENNPVEPPDKEDFTAARRLEHIQKEGIPQYTVREPYQQEKRLDEFYAASGEQMRLCKRGKVNALLFMIIVTGISLVYFTADFNPVTLVVAGVEILFAFFVFKGSHSARFMLTVFLCINPLICIMNFFDMFADLAKIIDLTNHADHIASPFTKAMYIITAVSSAAGVVFLVKNKALSAYCDSTGDIDHSLSDIVGNYFDTLAEKSKIWLDNHNDRKQG